MFREYGELKYRPSIVLKKLVRAGQLGVKTGEGFSSTIRMVTGYEYSRN